MNPSSKNMRGRKKGEEIKRRNKEIKMASSLTMKGNEGGMRSEGERQ